MYCSVDYHRFIHSPVGFSLKLCTAVVTHRFIHSPVGSSLKLCTAVLTIIDLYILL
jgi:hypothetical protein